MGTGNWDESGDGKHYKKKVKKMLTCFACDINNKETRREEKSVCVLLLIYHRERYGRDLSFKEKKDGSATD
ncbi:hypothetical protein YC2023_053279 [Brassica napus]